ncbi:MULTISPECIES: c-type cytochrome [unclassified Novosphingobium]|uniref:c-type cytochrome n=1 Tax=unclassified Novosphingobium TaxID=2644732 RepID=UPI00184C263C|nr:MULTISPECIES: c-type cytochrome [unclassified Novosphingobium]NMN03090.1 cytochrome c [Novosphingobium sp. SG919]NMN86922.1 cytochrome c [Novosphingobium sp. SG916]
MSKRLIAPVLAMTFAMAGMPQAAHAAPPPAPSTWARCAVCHDNTKGGPNKIGPNLYGVVGKKAGTHAPTFKYSDGLKKSGLTWNAATLDKWIENPRALVPGTMMAFPGLKDPAKRAELVGYLTSLK